MSGFKILSCMPERVTSGDSFALGLAALSVAYPTSDYTLQVIVKPGAAAAIVANMNAVGGVHSGTLAFTGVAAGICSYGIKAKRISDDAVQTVASGSITVLPDPATQDTRSHAEKTLAALEGLIEGRATKDVASYSIAGRSLTKMTPDELIKWRSHYRNEVAIQRRAGKPNGGRKITLARFQ